MTKKRRRSRSGKSLASLKAQGCYGATCEAERIAARLQVWLTHEQWEGIVTEWEQKPNATGLPEEWRDFLIGAAGQHNVNLAGI